MCVYVLQRDRDSKMSMLRPYSDEVGVLEEEIMQRKAKIVQVAYFKKFIQRKFETCRWKDGFDCAWFIMQLREEIAAFNEAKERVKPEVLEAEAKVKELQQNLDNLNSLQSNLRKARQAMKEKAQEMTKNVRNLIKFFFSLIFLSIISCDVVYSQLSKGVFLCCLVLGVPA